MQTSQQLAQDYIQTVGGTVSDGRKRSDTSFVMQTLLFCFNYMLKFYRFIPDDNMQFVKD